MTAETFTSLINLGAAGAVIVVVMIFLNYIAKRDQEWRDFFTILNAQNTTDMRVVTESLKQLTQGIQVLSDKIESHDSTMTKKVGELEEAAITLHAVTKTVFDLNEDFQEHDKLLSESLRKMADAKRKTKKEGI